MEDILKAVGTGVEWLSKLNYLTEIINMLKLRKSGKYVRTTCPIGNTKQFISFLAKKFGIKKPIKA